jgi:hypothetical protein
VEERLIAAGADALNDGCHASNKLRFHVERPGTNAVESFVPYPRFVIDDLHCSISKPWMGKQKAESDSLFQCLSERSDQFDHDGSSQVITRPVDYQPRGRFGYRIDHNQAVLA